MAKKTKVIERIEWLLEKIKDYAIEASGLAEEHNIFPEDEDRIMSISCDCDEFMGALEEVEE